MQHRVKTFIISLTILVISSAGISTVIAAQSGGHMQQLAAAMLTDIDQASWISEGKSPHVVYIFFDPNCPFCHKLYLSTRAWVQQGKLELRWIPTGILMTTSRGKAIAMLGADDPLQAFYQNEEHYSRSSGGGVDEDLTTPELEKKLQANESLLARTGLGAVPLMLYKNDRGEAMLVQGAPPKDRLAALLNHVK